MFALTAFSANKFVWKVEISKQKWFFFADSVSFPQFANNCLDRNLFMVRARAASTNCEETKMRREPRWKLHDAREYSWWSAILVRSAAWCEWGSERERHTCMSRTKQQRKQKYFSVGRPAAKDIQEERVASILPTRESTALTHKIYR